jgi:membrane-bound serine protease (ClpP class)
MFLAAMIAATETTQPAPDRPIDIGRVAGRTVFVVPIHGEIGRTMVYFVKRSVREAERQQAGVILFDFDTPGGDMGSMIEICNVLRRIEETPTIGFVNPLAGSAGAIILSGVRHIYMRDAGVVGAAALVASGPEGQIVELPPRVLEKYNSFIRAEVRALAEHNDHPFALFQAMVDQEIEVREVFVDGKREILTADDIGNLQVKLQRGEVQDLKFGPIISPKGRLLTLTNREAAEWGLSRGSVASRADLLRRIGLDDFRVVESTSTWADYVARFLMHPIVTLFLIVVGAVGIYLELNSPGVLIPGLVGVGAFAVLFFGQYVAGMAGVLEPILFLAGVALLAVEIFVLPGFGVAGIAGVGLILLSLVLAGQDFLVPRTTFEVEVFWRNVGTVFGGLALSVVAILLAGRYVPRTRLMSRITLSGTTAAVLVGSSTVEAVAAGEVGRAVSALRPAGRARFGQRFLDVVSEGQFIEPDTPIVVLRVEGNRIVVAPKKTNRTI